MLGGFILMGKPLSILSLTMFGVLEWRLVWRIAVILHQKIVLQTKQSRSHASAHQL